MKTVIAFIILSVPIVILSWHTIFHVKSHGFYRFLSWECIAWLLVNNIWFWFDKPFSPAQIISWISLIYAIFILIPGIIQLKKMGKSNIKRNDKSLYTFEKTTELVDTGIYKYIRHPLYSSLVFLTWGIFFKNTDLWLLVVALFSTVCLYITAKMDEKECVEFFGPKYSEYKRHSKMFVFFIW